VTDRPYKVLQVFAGIGGGCLGFEQARAEFRGVRARFETLAAIDVDPVALQDLELLTGGKAVQMDLFTREDYEAFHGAPPLEGWREATPADIRAACGGQRPDVVFGSPPCKGLSGLLSGARAASPKYQALNRLVIRWLFLVLEAFANDPPGLLLLENVPRIQTRGRALLDRVAAMLHSYGYAVAETVHDCGELGGLAQTRKRFLLVARRDAVDALLYEPPPQRLRTIGEVLGPMPMPELREAGPMHRLPRIERRTWERLALIRAGRDWRDLERRWAPGRWRLVQREGYEQLVELGPDGEPVADPTAGRDGPRFNNVARVAAWTEAGRTATGGGGPSSGGFTVADPRLRCAPRNGTMGVQAFDGPGATVTGSIDVHAGTSAVADPREPEVPVIISDDGCWHRPLSTLELAALQSFPTAVSGAPLVLTGTSASRWRMGIGNAVPPAAARAIGEQMLRTLLIADAKAFALSEGGGIWVREAGVLRWYETSRQNLFQVEVLA
jgi:site-specific DNA-cytosine methylase